MKTLIRAALAIVILGWTAAGAQAAGAAPVAEKSPAAAPEPVSPQPGTLADMPIREVTVFKDGHAFVLHEGHVATDAAGRVTLDYLPAPVLGTFWPYSADPKVALTGVTSGKRRVQVERTALSIQELIEGNVGAKVRIAEVALSEKEAPVSYEAVIVGIPTRSGEELRRTSPPGTEERLPEKGGLVLLKTETGVRAVPIARIAQLTFVADPKPGVADEEFRNILSMTFNWPGGKPEKTANVGMVYLQRGIRWIPQYRVDIDGKGEAHIKLQATLINELADLVDVKAHLVVGVPKFDFKDTVDPMSLQQSVAQLSSYFRENAQTAYAFSNSIMTQAARMNEVRGPGQVPPGAAVIDLGPEVSGSQKSEDLYIFTVEHITLKKGERMVVQVNKEYTLPYRDVYTLNLPFGPPRDIRQNFNTQQQTELARLMSAPKAKHIIRLQNKTDQPLTTAPALILKEGRLLAQGMMTYTAIGATSDLEITTAVDISVERSDKETGRVANATTWHGNAYDRVDLAGQVHLVNHGAKPAELEVTRYILGVLDSAEQNGKVEQLGGWDNAWAADIEMPAWWSWYSWPNWWYEFNGLGRAKWTLTVDPDKSADLDYKWHYFWR